MKNKFHQIYKHGILHTPLTLNNNIYYKLFTINIITNLKCFHNLTNKYKISIKFISFKILNKNVWV